MRSDLSRLYLYARGDGATSNAFENFTTEALALVVRRDPAPMLSALRRLDWSPDPNPVTAAVDGVLTRTQLPLHRDRSRGLRSGFVDLALDLTAGAEVVGRVWVEVKIDSPEHGRQWETYSEHAGVMDAPRPQLISLSPRLLPNFRVNLFWRDLFLASRASRSWIDFAVFLEDMKLDVDERIPTAGPVLCRDELESISVVVLAANSSLKQLYPMGSPSLAWVPGTLLRTLKARWPEGKGTATSGGPLRYGYETRESGATWFVRLALEPSEPAPLEVIRHADARELPDHWLRDNRSECVLEWAVEVSRLPTREEASTWFARAFGELEEARILQLICPDRAI